MIGLSRNMLCVRGEESANVLSIREHGAVKHVGKRMAAVVGAGGVVSGKAHLGGSDELVCSVTEQLVGRELSTDATTVSSRAQSANQSDASGDTYLG